jgi:hypothetical protein
MKNQLAGCRGSIDAFRDASDGNVLLCELRNLGSRGRGYVSRFLGSKADN